MSSDWLSLRSELFNFLTYALPVISTSGCQSTEQSRSGLDWLADDKIKELGQKDKRGEHKIKLINDLFASSYPYSPFPVSHFCRVARGWWSVALHYSLLLLEGPPCLPLPSSPLPLYRCRETTETVCCNVSSDSFS